MIRRRRTGADASLLYAVASILLRYPDERVVAAARDVPAALPSIAHPAAHPPLREFAAWLSATGPGQAARHYVATFDLQRRCSLYVSYYRYGDTRARGMALLALKDAYRRAGMVPPEHELPDFLPVLLEFAAYAPEPGYRLLVRYLPGIELLRRALVAADSPYARLLDALCAALPALGTGDLAQVHRLAGAGPPVEVVGLEPFAPPEYLTGERR